jgi:hypothetical protein
MILRLLIAAILIAWVGPGLLVWLLSRDVAELVVILWLQLGHLIWYVKTKRKG